MALYPGRIWIMGLLEGFCFLGFFFFDGLSSLVFKKRLWVVDIVQ